MIPGLVAFLLAAAPSPEPKKAPPTPPPRFEKPIGTGTYGVETIDSLQGEGLIKLNGTQVTELQVNGRLLSKDATLGSATIHGEANLRDTIVQGDITLVGALQTNGVNFQKALTLCVQKACFTKTTLRSLSVRQERSYKGKQIIELKQGTVVTGPIHFDSGKGEVHLDSSSRVEGPVTGGVIKRVSSSRK